MHSMFMTFNSYDFFKALKDFYKHDYNSDNFSTIGWFRHPQNKDYNVKIMK